MANTTAWMLRQDGIAFPCKVHLYTMADEDLSSEAEVASFLIATKSKDIGVAETILDAWMAMLIEDTVSYDDDAAGIRDCIKQMLGLLPYSFPFPLSDEEYLKIHDRLCNYTNIDEYYEYLDRVRAELPRLQDMIRKSLNQQFCRVRYGGQYDTHNGNNTIWFRISSVGYNWANTIYVFASENRRKWNIEKITICRDYESDHGDVNGKPEYFYKAKDGSVYYDMPIDEFLNEEHEHSLVFSTTELNRGVLATMRQKLAEGSTYQEVVDVLSKSDIEPPFNTWKHIMRSDWAQCIEASEFLDNAHPRTHAKLMGVKRRFESQHPQVKIADIDVEPRANTRGKMVGCEVLFLLESDIKELWGVNLSVVYNRGVSDIPGESIYRDLCREFDSYVQYKKIQLN